MELAFASLHQLCAPLLDRLERLPGPQRDALRIVFGLTAGPAPDRFLVGLAVLSLVSEAAEQRPLLCVVDDAQWLDQTSALTLAFVARRLLAEPVGLVFAAREPGEELRHLPRARGARPGQRRRPRAAELGGAVRAGQAGPRPDPRGDARQPARAARAAPRADADAAGRRVRDAGGRRSLAAGSSRATSGGSSRSPTDARRLLLVAAAEPVGDPLLLQRACERLGIALAAVDATDGLLALEERVTFRHPLARSAVYRSAGGAGAPGGPPGAGGGDGPRRRSGSSRVAPGGRGGRARRGRSRASSSCSAGRAQARGGLAAAAAFLQRAVALTGDPARRADRALAAAQASLGAGAFDVARGLLAAAEAGPLDELGRARVDLLQAEVAFAQNRGGDAPLLLLQAARKLETLDVRLSRDTYLDAWAPALFAGQLAAPAAACSTSPAPRPPRPPGRTRRSPRDLLLDGLALVFTDGRAAATPVLRRAVAAFAGPEVSDDGDAPLGLAGDAGGELRVGLRPLPRDRHARGAARPRLRGARGPRRRGQRVRPGRRVRRRLRDAPRC